MWMTCPPPPFTRCPCRVDGIFGLKCDIVVETACLNQCAGHGECVNQGFCKCHKVGSWLGRGACRRLLKPYAPKS